MKKPNLKISVVGVGFNNLDGCRGFIEVCMLDQHSIACAATQLKSTLKMHAVAMRLYIRN